MQRREPLIFVFITIAAGIVIATYCAFGIRETLGCCLSLVLTGVLAQRAGRRTASVAFGMALVSGGIGLAILRERTKPASLSVPDNSIAIFAGCVVDPSLRVEDRERLVVELAPGARAQVTLFARAGVGFPSLPYGTQVEFTGKVRRLHNYNNPGSFDAVKYFARQGIFWNASANAESVRVLPGNCGSWFRRWIFALRSACLDRLDRFYANDAYSNGMMQAVLIGVTARMDRMWTEDYRSTGTFHALVISGSHIAVVAGLLLFLLRVCAVPWEAAFALAVGVAWIYAALTGWQAPVLRPVAAMALYGAGRIFFRRARLLNLLAAIALAFVIVDPEELFDASFQLSFLAVALIGAFAAPVIEKTSAPLAHGLTGLADSRRDIRMEPKVAQFRIELRLLAETAAALFRLPQAVARWSVAAIARLWFYLQEIFVTSLFIQIGLTLPMVIFFHRVSFSGLSANAVVVPVLGAVVPLGFLAIALNSQTLANVCAWLLSISRAAVALHARWEPDWRIPSPPVWLACLLGAALICAAWRGAGRWVRSCAWCATVLLLGMIILHPFRPATERGRMELDAIDVGQGDSLLAAFPDGKLMLIDAGGFPVFGPGDHKPGIDIGEDVVSRYLWTRSIRHLDVVAMTHAHQDHMGGMRAVLRNFRPRELWVGAVGESPEWKAVRETARELHIPVRRMVQCPPFDFGGARVEILAPDGEYRAGSVARNDDSLVMRIQYGSTAFLLTGDMEKKIEQRLADTGLLQHTDVLKVGHHGSRTSSSPGFLDAVRPGFGIISDGYENSYGHPHPLTIAALAERHTAIYRTDERGLIRISSDGRRIRVD